MREIKFRGIEKKTKKWVYGTLFAGRIYEQPEFGTSHNYHDFGKEVIEETIGQCTGQNDVSGADIYEGDILSNGCKRDCIVKFTDGAFLAINCVGTTHGLSKNEIAEYELEIIGNIHQNKELLK